MCVVQLDFSNTVVNKGIEDIFPDDPAVIAEAAKRKEEEEEQEKSAQASSSRTTGPDVPCPSSAPPFIFSAPAPQMPRALSSYAAYSPGPSSKLQHPSPISITKLDERQPSLSTQSHHSPHSHPLTHSPPIPQKPPIARLSPPETPRRFSVLSPGEYSLTPSVASFHEALRILYQKHTSSSTPTRPGPSTLPPVSVPHLQHPQQSFAAPYHHPHLLTSGQLKRFSTDEVEGVGGPSSTSQDVAMPAVVVSSATSQSSHSFPRRQSESGLYQLSGRMQRFPPGEQMTLKRVRSEQQSFPFSTLRQQPSRPRLSFTMGLGEQVPVSDPEQLARNLIFPLLNPPPSFGVTAPGSSCAPTITPTDPTSATHVVTPSRRTSALDLLLMTEGEARQFTESMLAGSSPSHPDRPSHLPTGLTPALRSFTASTPAGGSTSQIFNFAGASSSDVVIASSSVSSSTPANRPVPSSSGPSTSTSVPVLGPSTSTEFHTGFRRSEAAKCRRVYGAVNKSRWCKQCRWKKACTRFQGPSPHQKDPPDLT